MSFLDDLINSSSVNAIDEGLIAQIENLIWFSSLDEREKARLMKRMMKLETIEGAMQMINYLEQSQPIVGLDRVPLTQYEIVEATRRRVEREDFKERKK